MEKKYPVRLGELMKKNFADNTLFADGMKEATIMKSWLEIVGQELAECTIKLYIREHKLYVSFSSPTAKSAFYVIRKNVLYRLNGKVGEPYLKLIIVI